MDLNTTYEAIRISSGNSFVHETESQVILNGSRNINFTMDLVLKDVSLFDQIAERHGIPLELSPMLVEIFKDGMERYGEREWSSNIIRRLEDATSINVRATGFPDEITCDEEEVEGQEVIPIRNYLRLNLNLLNILSSQSYLQDIVLQQDNLNLIDQLTEIHLA